MGAEVAGPIEANRAAIEERVACSYRLQLDPKRGNFFAAGNGFEAYTTRSRELAHEYEWVLMTDIADFYNQISVHRVRNVLSTAAGKAALLDCGAERFLLNLNSGTSTGIPVGPTTSIVLAEAICADIDDFLGNAGVTHTRYADDFRLFADSKEGLNEYLRGLTLYLYSTHRLSLSPVKTVLTTAEKFLDSHLDAPTERRRRRLHGDIDVIVQPYAFLDAVEPKGHSGELRDKSLADERRNRLLILMNQVCDMEELDLGVARHVLRACRRHRLRAIIPLLLEHFDLFRPVLNDVVFYLDSVGNQSFLDRNADRLHEICVDSATTRIPFGRMWLAELVTRLKPLLEQDRFRRWVYESGEFTAAATAAMVLRDTTWVRAQKARLAELRQRDRRDLIRASAILPRDERLPWLRTVRQGSSSFLEECLVSWASGQQP